MPPDALARDLDEAALYLLWYARARKYRDLMPLRTVALPVELLSRRWATELELLLGKQIISCDAFIGRENEAGTDCRAVVLYRPVLRALRFWETWVLTFAPIIGTLGILWTSSRRK